MHHVLVHHRRRAERAVLHAFVLTFDTCDRKAKTISVEERRHGRQKIRFTNDIEYSKWRNVLNAKSYA